MDRENSKCKFRNNLYYKFIVQTFQYAFIRRNSSSRAFLYAGKPPSIVLTVFSPHNHVSLATICISCSLCETNISPPQKEQDSISELKVQVLIIPLLKTSKSVIIAPNKAFKTLFAALQSEVKIYKTNFFSFIVTGEE